MFDAFKRFGDVVSDAVSSIFDDEESVEGKRQQRTTASQQQAAGRYRTVVKKKSVPLLREILPGEPPATITGMQFVYNRLKVDADGDLAHRFIQSNGKIIRSRHNPAFIPKLKFVRVLKNHPFEHDSIHCHYIHTKSPLSGKSAPNPPPPGWIAGVKENKNKRRKTDPKV